MQPSEACASAFTEAPAAGIRAPPPVSAAQSPPAAPTIGRRRSIWKSQAYRSRFVAVIGDRGQVVPGRYRTLRDLPAPAVMGDMARPCGEDCHVILKPKLRIVTE